MSEAVQTEVSKTTIRPNTAAMVKTAGGSFHKDDPVGNLLNGLTIEQVLDLAKAAEIDGSKYSHLNVGQQRMNIGNRLRGLLKKDENGNLLAKLTKLVDPLKAANAKAEAAAKEAKAKEAADKKAATKETPAKADKPAKK